MVMEQTKMTQVLQAKKWSSIESIRNLEKLKPDNKKDMCTIFLDTNGSEPEVLSVSSDVFRGKTGLSIRFDKISELESVLGTLILESDAEFMACLQQSQIDKKNGKTRKYEDIARECGLKL